MGLRILIVEDDKHIRKLLEQLLTHEPSLAARRPEIIAAADGKEGLAALDQGPYDLVISDLLMPRLDGFGFARELRKHRHGAEVPLFITSAVYKDQATINQLHAETGAQFFAKPVQMRDLLAAVKRLVGDGGKRAASSARSASGAQPSVGALAERAPPRILLELWEKRTSATLTLQRGKIKKEVALVHGAPVAVSSNLRTETLGHFLVAGGVIDENRRRVALARAQEAQERLGQALVELGWLSGAELIKQLTAQTRAKIINVLRWRDGDWMLMPGPPPTLPLQTPIDAPRVVFGGLRRSAHVDEIAQRLAEVRGRVALTLRAERHREAFVRVFGAEGLTALQRRPLLQELLAGTDPAPMLVQIDALLVCGMAEIDSGAVGHKPAAARAIDPIALERLPAVPALAAAPPAEPSLYDRLFGDEPSQQVRAPEPGLQPFDEDEAVSGVIHVPTGSGPAPPSPAAPVVADDAAVTALRQEVLREYLALQGKDYYQLLRLRRDAAPAEIAAAYDRLAQPFRLERFADLDLGPDYARVEEIHALLRAAFATLSAPQARAAYDAELERPGRPSKAAVEAELAAQKAVERLDAGDAASACALLEAATAAAPDQADYHALLAWAVFQAEGANIAAGTAAWRHLHAAFEIDRDHLGAHECAGHIAARAGDDARALDHLTRVLDAAPTRADALATFEAVCLRAGDTRRLERQYRKLIHRLGDTRDPERTLGLWWRLAELYRTHLGDPSAAKTAYETAARLAPDDPRSREALARLYAHEPAAWHDATQALREAWRLQPDDPGPGRALFQLHVEGGRWDAAYAVAAALAVRGGGDQASAELWRRFRPRFLTRARQPLDEAPPLTERVRHPDEDRALSQLFARVFAVWQPPFGWDVLGVTPADELDPTLLPVPFARVLTYCAQQLGVAVPRLYRRADFAADVHVGAAHPPILLAGPQALALADTTALAFRVGRALTYLLPGRAIAGALPARQLKHTLLATLTLAQPSLRIDDPDGDVRNLRLQLAAAAPALSREVAPLCEHLVARAQATLNVARYARGLARTADRIGLVLCNDLATAVQIVVAGGAPGADNDLIDFALSDRYLAAREALGLSITV